ncbi:hypothetical protein PVK06_021324 [Gossypium arboreum]|uniref:RNase H type-1 domain-containing protein n=1 Tax=Gossypium arboreum TaxID=29729 RepID=A0ABR0PQ70_GOSAR|nr:hypothetical protein PVK06_021324 [Gossypium arboreum]
MPSSTQPGGGSQFLKVVEGDSLSLIKKANSSGDDRSTIGAYIQDIRIVRQGLKKCEIVYAPHEANRPVHFLAQEGLRRGEGLNLEYDYLVEMVALNCGGDGEDDAGGAMAFG